MKSGIGLQVRGVLLGEQLFVRVVLKVVEPRDALEADAVLVERRVVVEEPRLVVADLDRRMRNRAQPMPNECFNAAVRVGRRRFTPLLQLDDDGVLGLIFGVTSQQGIQSAAGVAELVFEDHSVVIEVSLADQERKRGQAVLPALELGGARFVPDLRDVLAAELLGDPMHSRIGQKQLGRLRVEPHSLAVRFPLGMAAEDSQHSPT